ncbi:MAG: enoyl-CoA hydratase-related protein [Tatlockia sp.]
MSDLVMELHNRVLHLRLNRVEKCNAFDDHLLLLLQQGLDEALANPAVRVILLKAAGKHFSAGADIAWMQRMVQLNEAENIEDAMVLARVLFTLQQSTKPTIAMVQGAAFGGGVGLIAACDMAVAAHSARFCFSEIKLGLIPAVISPYVVNAIGARATRHLFMTAEIFDAQTAKNLSLVQHCVADEALYDFTVEQAEKMAHLPPKALTACKRLVDEVANQPLDEKLLRYTATCIAKQRVSAEGQKGLQAFLNKESPDWT